MLVFKEEGSLRRGRRGKCRILGVGGGGGWWCHLGFLAVDIFSCSVSKTKSVCLFMRRKRGVKGIRRRVYVVINGRSGTRRATS